MENKDIIKSYLIGLYYCEIKSRLDNILFKNPMGRERRFMYDKEIMKSADETHILIRQIINRDGPFMIARFGFTEAALVGSYHLMEKTGLKLNYKRAAGMLYDTAGFFTHKMDKYTDIDRFCELMTDCTKDVDLLGVNYSILEDYIVNHYCQNAVLTDFNHLAMLRSDAHWGSALKGKKVLVVHPFSDTIEKQYLRREKIWGDKTEEILPEFELITYKAIQTIAGNNVDKYNSWFEALDIMKNDIRQIDFDVAIIGCGAYGFPLASDIKRSGRGAIHLGGQTQVIFGITGKRYEDQSFYNDWINEYWVHPSAEETPENYRSVEGGCYW